MSNIYIKMICFMDDVGYMFTKFGHGMEQEICSLVEKDRVG